MKYHIAIIIPAAGFSKRHPPNKLLVQVEHRPAIVETVSKFTDFPVDIIVVVGHEKKQIMPPLEKAFGNRIKIAENPHYHQGLSRSLQVGIKAAGNAPDYFGFCVGDKPFLHLTTVGMLLETIHQKSPDILVPLFKGTVGHPNFFARRFKKDLMQLTGDTGGRSLFQTYHTKTYFLPVKDKGVILDMDQFLSGAGDLQTF